MEDGTGAINPVGAGDIAEDGVGVVHAGAGLVDADCFFCCFWCVVSLD